MIYVLSLMFFAASFVVLTFADATVADEIVICASEANQYVAQANSEDQCRDGENRVSVASSGVSEKLGQTPVATFTPIDECDGAGVKMELGFDENANGELDSNEIMTTIESCKASG